MRRKFPTGIVKGLEELIELREFLDEIAKQKCFRNKSYTNCDLCWPCIARQLKAKREE
jgi:hypothetical protein